MTDDPDWRATAEALEKQLQEYDRIIFAERRRFLDAVYRWATYSAELEQHVCDLEREQVMVKDSYKQMFACPDCQVSFFVTFEDGGPAEIVKSCEKCGCLMIVRASFGYALLTDSYSPPRFEQTVREIAHEVVMESNDKKGR